MIIDLGAFVEVISSTFTRKIVAPAFPTSSTFGISGGAKRRPLHAVVGRHVAHAILRRHE